MSSQSEVFFPFFFFPPPDGRRGDRANAKRLLPSFFGRISREGRSLYREAFFLFPPDRGNNHGRAFSPFFFPHAQSVGINLHAEAVFPPFPLFSFLRGLEEKDWLISPFLFPRKQGVLFRREMPLVLLFLLPFPSRTRDRSKMAFFFSQHHGKS